MTDIETLGMTTTAIERLRRNIDASRRKDMSAPNVRRGDVVVTWGPWSNGHEEQCAIVTNVFGNGVLVNLRIFVDEGADLWGQEIPFFHTKTLALAAMAMNTAGDKAGGAICAYFHDKD